MKTENKLKHAILLGVMTSTSMQAAEVMKLPLNQNNTSLNNNEKIATTKHVNKMVTIQGVDTWVTDDQSINELDLEPIKYKLISEDNTTGLTLKQVDEIGEKYRTFLYLSKKYPNHNIVPSKEVDMFWHAHILDTYKYQEDCEKIFGRFFHHYPYFGMKDKNDENNLENSFNETLDLYRKEFPSKISNKMIARGALCIGEPKPMAKALCIGEPKPMAKALCIGEPKPMAKALCIGEPKPMAKALCIGEPKPMVNEQPSARNDGTFEDRGRPRFDRATNTVIFN